MKIRLDRGVEVVEIVQTQTLGGQESSEGKGWSMPSGLHSWGACRASNRVRESEGREEVVREE